ncbi:hypothetical protein Golob_022209 [Gossypium lobatum]|uniref:Mal d 1-associated protein n=1 Tax=Gossypium lobatum TaxID=34289 RepID=A0A7J8LG11_9ROSI|nr:hypothetical protein [Gossypium lobatum]
MKLKITLINKFKLFLFLTGFYGRVCCSNFGVKTLPVEVLQSTKEYTEDDVTEQMLKGSFSSGSHIEGSFDFPGLRSDMEAIERQFFGGINRFFDAAEEMKNNFFDIFGDAYGRGSSSAPSIRRGIPIEDHKRKEDSPKPTESGHIDLSGLAKDI